MAIAKYSKAPVERKRYNIDYSEWLDTSETVSTVTFVAEPVSALNPLVIDDIMVTPALTGVQYYVSGGVVGVTYKVHVTMTTFPGQIKEDDIFFTIREP